MSAVSSESQLAAADLSAPPVHPSSPAQPGEAATSGSADFGANEWLVDELYQQYLADPGSVDKAWWSFFADYRPVMVTGNGSAAAAPAPEAAPPAPPAPAQPQAQVPAPARGADPAPVAAPAPAPAQPAAPAPAAKAATPVPDDAEVSRLRGAAARTALNMSESLSVPVATSVRAVPAKLLIDNRI